jgi:hypothetical protein
LNGLVVEAPGPADSNRIARETGLLDDDDMAFFLLRTDHRLGYVLASVVADDEDHGEYSEPSRFGPGHTEMGPG